MGRCRSVLWVFVDRCRLVECGWVGCVGFCVLEVVVVVGTVKLLDFFFFGSCSGVWWWGGGCLSGFW